MKTKLIKSLLLALIAAMLPQLASAYDFMVNGLCYNYNEDGTSITVTEGGHYTGDITIPSSVTYSGNTYSVTGIGLFAFEGCTGLTSVTIPNTVTEIAGNAFYGCAGLTSVTIPNSVTSIGDNAFRCSGLTSVTIPNSVTSISSGTFSECSSLTSVDIPNSVTSIGGSAFSGCTGLTSVDIPNSVTSIGDEAFSGCTGLTTVTIPNSVTSISYCTFSGCSSLTSVDIPNSVTSIGDGAFLYCSSLPSVNIPNSVTSIGHEAFSMCSGLTSVIIPSSVTWIGSEVFWGCALTSVTLNSNSIVSKSYGTDHNIGSIFGRNVHKYIFGNAITSIGNNAFYGCAGLKEIIIPNSVNSIGWAAFMYCSDLEKITIPNSVDISGYNFVGCPSLTSMTLIGQGAWNIKSYMPSINQLTTLTIGSGITSLGDFGFTPDTVKCYASIPPACSSGTFANYDGELHVPTTSIASYFIADYWQFFNMFNDITDKITINQIEADLIIDETLNLTATAITADANVIWCSSDPSVATVDDCGIVTAVGNGECDIYATIDSNPAVYAYCHITVSYPEISISLSEQSLDLKVGEDSLLVASILPNNLGLTPTWSSSNENVATVVNGLVTAIGEGECDITVVVQDKTATCHVTVSYPEITLTISNEFLEMIVGNEKTITATIIPDNIGLIPIWTSSDEKVATVENGIVTAIGQGECDIIVTVLDKTASCHVIVGDFDVSITLSKDNAIIGASQILTVYPTCTPDVQVELVVTSSDPSVALARVVNRTNAPAQGLQSFPEKGMTMAYLNELTNITVESKTPAYASEKAIMIVGVQNGTATITVTTADGKAVPAVLELRVVDVDGDRTITATDITCLYNYLLNSDESYIATSDVDGDGFITSADITVLYNLMLGNN